MINSPPITFLIPSETCIPRSFPPISKIYTWQTIYFWKAKFMIYYIILNTVSLKNKTYNLYHSVLNYSLWFITIFAPASLYSDPHCIPGIKSNEHARILYKMLIGDPPIRIGCLHGSLSCSMQVSILPV